MTQSLFIILAGFLSFISMPLIILFCKKFSLYDYQNARKIHSGNIPRLGGVGIFFSFIISACIFLFITKAEKTENGWNLTIQPAKENGGAANESNE